MHKLTFGLLVLFALFSLIVAIPIPEPDSDKIDELEKRMIWFSPGSAIAYWPATAGKGACGRTYNDYAVVVSVPSMFFDSGERCGTNMQIQALDSNDNPIGHPVTATIADECKGCSNNNFDLSIELWYQLGATVAPIDIRFSFMSE
ncbi:hypothetical protein BJV77DRAFT_167388 [Russula vinacea]|nr:hypothetical protein BJV77DRAFT_167388 [Russula vinacea]